MLTINKHAYKSYWEQNIRKPRYLTSSQIFVKPEILEKYSFFFYTQLHKPCFGKYLKKQIEENIHLSEKNS